MNCDSVKVITELALRCVAAEAELKSAKARNEHDKQFREAVEKLLGSILDAQSCERPMCRTAGLIVQFECHWAIKAGPRE